MNIRLINLEVDAKDLVVDEREQEDIDECHQEYVDDSGPVSRYAIDVKLYEFPHSLEQADRESRPVDYQEKEELHLVEKDEERGTDKFNAERIAEAQKHEDELNRAASVSEEGFFAGSEIHLSAGFEDRRDDGVPFEEKVLNGPEDQDEGSQNNEEV